MPWNPSDATGKTKKANTPARKKQWADVANNILERTGDDARAVRGANAAVAKHPSMVVMRGRKKK